MFVKTKRYVYEIAVFVWFRCLHYDLQSQQFYFPLKDGFTLKFHKKNQCYYCNKIKINHFSNGNVSFILVWSAVCCVTCAVFPLYNVWNVGHTYYAIQPYYGSFESIYCVEWWIFTPKLWTSKKRIKESLTKNMYIDEH